MKKQDKKRVAISEKNYLSIVEHNTKLIQENLALTGQIEELRKQPDRNPYHITLKMYTDHEVKTWDFSELLKTVQFESPALLVKLLRRIHHNYSVLNIQEMTSALNRGGPYVSKWDEGVTNHLYILKLLADNIEAIKEV